MYIIYNYSLLYVLLHLVKSDHNSYSSNIFLILLWSCFESALKINMTWF